MRGDTGVLGVLNQRRERELQGLDVAPLIMANEGQVSGKLGLIRKLGPTGFEGQRGGFEFTQVAQARGQPDDRAALFVGRKTQGDGPLVVGSRGRIVSERLVGPGQLVSDFGDMWVLPIQGFKLREQARGLAAVTSTGDGIERGTPGGNNRI